MTDVLPRRMCGKVGSRPQGPGEILKRKTSFLRWLRKGGCQCDQHTARMDVQGIPWCERNIDLIVQWMIDGWILGDVGGDVAIASARKMVKSSIAEAKLARVAAYVTIGVTACKRPAHLKRCLDSFDRHWPGVTIIVDDTEGNLSASRNRLVAKTETTFFLLVEDDMEADENTHIDVLLNIVFGDSQLAGCGGVLNDQCWAYDFEEVDGELIASPSRQPTKVTRDGFSYQPCQLIMACGLFRTEALKENPWDENLELMEHREVFHRLAMSGWKVALSRDCTLGWSRNTEFPMKNGRGRS